MTAAADAQSMIENLIANRAQQLAEAQAAEKATKAAEAQQAREARRQHIITVLGDLWPVFEPYTAACETWQNGDAYTEIDPRPLQLARFWVQPAYNRHGSPAIEFYLALRHGARTVDAGRLDDMLLILREAYQEQQRTAAEQAAEQAAQQAQQAQQAELKAAYKAQYLAYRLEYNRIQQHNAGQIDAWNKAHARSYQVKQIAYPVGADEDSAGEATAWIATYPNGGWTDAAGYMLIPDYYGPASRRRFARIIWEDAPQTYTPGPGSQLQRQAVIAVNYTIYAPPAEQQIQEEAADLYAAMILYPAWPEPPEGLYNMHAAEARQEIDGEIGDHHRNDLIPY